MAKEEVIVQCTEINEALPKWPVEPRDLRLGLRDRIFWTLYDLVLTVLPIILIVKAGLCIVAERRDRENTDVFLDRASYLSQLLIRLNGQLVTLFTIVFVTIISTCVKRYALYKAQKGAYLSTLEQLQGSVSLPSTLKLIWSLRSFGVLSGFLMFLWTFYYVGSQAVKDEFQLSDSDAFKKYQAGFRRADAPSLFTPNVTIFPDSLEVLQQNFLVELIKVDDNIKNAGSNIGPLIPDYDNALAGFSHDADAIDNLRHRLQGWIDVSVQSKLVFTGHVGNMLYINIPYVIERGVKVEDNPFPGDILGHYTMENLSYMKVGCDQITYGNVSDFPAGTSGNASTSLNFTSPIRTSSSGVHSSRLKEFIWSYRFHVNNLQDDTSTDILLQSRCNITTVHVDLQVKCSPTGCHPQRMRLANNTNLATATSLSTPFDSTYFTQSFMNNLWTATGLSTNWTIGNLLERSMNGGIDQSKLEQGSVNDTSELGNPAIGIMQMINTYHTMSQNIITYEGTHLNYTALRHGQMDPEYQYQLVTDFNGARYVKKYRIYWQWLSLDIISCTILLVAAIFSYWLRIKTLAPDIFGYVSSLTRDNENLALPTHGSALSGIERAQKLKNLKVKIGDLNTHGDGSVGRIGLAAAGQSVQQLQSNRRFI